MYYDLAVHGKEADVVKKEREGRVERRVPKAPALRPVISVERARVASELVAALFAGHGVLSTAAAREVGSTCC